MRLTVITPVGPGHEKFVERCRQSVPVSEFYDVRHVIIDDSRGVLGRSKARNSGMDDAEWFFFLDADDTMRPDALSLNDFGASATFGAISLDGKIYDKNVYPCGWRELAQHGAEGTLSMGFFCRGDVARALRFNEDMDAGEDFDFYLRLPDFVKIERPLVDIGYSKPSAIGPRGYANIDWTGLCNRVIDDFGRDALLAKAGGADGNLVFVQDALSEPRT